jgi:NADH-quinone oxidoreductase subunit B
MNADLPSEFIVPEFGAHDLVPTQNSEVWKAPLVNISIAGKNESGRD